MSSETEGVCNEKCCLPTCKIFSCPAGFNNINLGSVGFSQDNCC